jgi:peroxiredoxin
LQIQFNTYTMHLEEEPLDIGYASEKVAVTDKNGQSSQIGGQKGCTQLIVSAPFVDAAFNLELKKLSDAIENSPLMEATTSLVVANGQHDTEETEGFGCFIDSDEGFGDWYGVRLKDGPLEGELTKALFVITKDGALYYDEIVSNLHTPFDVDKAISKIAAAQECYTGKGCH